ncbi:hypothetical protein K437DRAFT_290154 [Tilletiaria anomala UBC 951]|uniref:Uncharacterized protein n=1 Tax=Tilletiaria anomala (strain ATCC 24038 / CBS 436.72 / UBC 951) TaxID=1037660 RepID=A0A066WK51_TILAU|nr:uncharacterized protein K437DRAFT_290154 [Tilletiaria anomala UBC 951]KDN51389.1 hypothetical protein K437DRAFT_290154 [Tilletiaria anomala UBC 951]
MSLSDIVSGGAACGPTNPLQQLGKRFGQDRSSQLDRYGNTDAGPSGSASMRTTRPDPGGGAAPGIVMRQPPVSGGSFDLSVLEENLPRKQHQNQRQSSFASGFSPSPLQRQGSPLHYSPAFNVAFQVQSSGGSPAAAAALVPPAWAADFLASTGTPRDQKFMQARQSVSKLHHQEHQHQRAQRIGTSHFHQPMMGYDLQKQQQNEAYSFLQHPQMMPGFQQPAFQNVGPVVAAPATAHFGQADDSQWASAFTTFEKAQLASIQVEKDSAASNRNNANAELAAKYMSTLLSTPSVQEATSQEPIPPADADELAEAAGKLVATIDHDQSSKFKQSNFLELMRRIRDKQAGIRGTDIVDTPDGVESGATMSTMDKGKGKASETSGDEMHERFRRPETAQEAYSWANEMATNGHASRPPPAIQSSLGRTSSYTYDAAKHMPLTPGPTTYENETTGRAELAEMWAEEDARSEALEQAKMKEAQERLKQQENQRRTTFIGDSGDVEAREREDLFAHLHAEDELRGQQQQRNEDPEAAEFAKFQRLGTQVPGAKQGWVEESGDAQDMNEDEDAEADFVGRRWEGTKGRGVAGAQAAEWDRLQQDWDAWEATASGMQRAYGSQQGAQHNMRPALKYPFQQDNPYMSAATHHHAQHAEMPEMFESLLESEARVQMNPTDANAWLDLGVKEQENERETHAIAALCRAVELDPKLRDAWLALAVSYTNENDRSQAFEAIEQWIQGSDQYAEVVRQHRGDGKADSPANMTPLQRHNALTDTLIALARHGSAAGQVDADVQIALGVLFNASEEYDKAVDCFASALSVRPEDWLLYNRLGATLSNSGKSSEAMSYYHHALSLQPSFVRCHFNLSISCLNLKLYQDAAEHIYSALSIQASQSAHLQPATDGKEAGVGSTSLWETFRVALELMGRPDLANLCSARDISVFDPTDLVPRPREAPMET